MAKGTPDDPIVIEDESQATKNLCYLIKPKEKADGKAVSTTRSPDRRET
jgi:hypothetical protein